MKNYKKIIGLLLSAVLCIALFAGCGGESNAAFSYSDGLDENGFWAGVKAQDYIVDFDYNGILIPEHVHRVPEEDVQAEIEYILEYFAGSAMVTDREVAYGDLVNIDYVGSVDGVEFAGGSTGGNGAEVTAGSMDYIDDFLTQIIGHMPGETINVEVRFPDTYYEADLQGKDALFVTTINHIVDMTVPELTDAFVEAELSFYHGWMTVAEMQEEIRMGFQRGAIEEYIRAYLSDEVEAKSIPDALVDYQVKSMQDFYQGYADMYDITLEEFLQEYVDVSGWTELLANNQEENLRGARYSLAIQAAAEAAGIVADVDDVAAFFLEHTGTSDYAEYEEQYGMPYLMQLALQQKVIVFMIDLAVLA